MDTQASMIMPNPVLYEANPHFSDAVNRNIIQSEIEGGVYLRDLPPGSALSIQTRSRVYEMVILGDGAALLSGHPEFCPEPTEVQIQGSTWGGSMLKAHFVGRGMHLEYVHPLLNRTITSRILDIRVH
jgi:hypothetical protein